MKLYFLENESSVAPLLASPDYQAGVDCLICLNWLVLIRLRPADGRHHFIFGDDLLSPEDLEALNERLDAISFGWFRPGGRDFTLSGGISIGELAVGMPVRQYFAGVLLKYGEIIRRAVLRWPGAENILHDLAGGGISAHQWTDETGATFDKGGLVSAVGAQLGLPCAYLPAPRALQSAFVANRESKSKPQVGMRQWLRAGLRNGLGPAFDLINRAIRALHPGDRRIYLFPYNNNQAALLSRLDRRFVLRTLPPRQMLGLMRQSVTFLDFAWRTRKSLSRPAAAVPPSEEIFRAGEADEEWRALFVHQGMDYSAMLRPSLAVIADQELPELAAHTASIRSHLKRENIGTLVLNDTLDERNRAAVAACRAEGAQSIFVDHGIMGLRHGLRACNRAEPDLVVKPGEFDPYRHKTRTVALGNPCMDAYAPGTVKPIRAIRRILFLSFEDNFYARLDRFAFQEKYYEEMFAIFPTLIDAGIEILYKPHPGESSAYHDYLFQFFGVDAAQVQYVQQLPFADVVREADLVVCNVTSCYYEAQAAGVPTVFLEPTFIPEALCPPLNGEHGREVQRMGSGPELLAFIMAHKDAPEPLLEQLGSFLREQAPRYMGPIDGKVSSRIMDEIIAIHNRPQSDVPQGGGR